MKQRIIGWVGLAVLATVAWAQSTSSTLQFDRAVASVLMLQSEAVRKELKISDAQRTKLNRHADKFNKDAKTYQDALVKQGEKAKRDPAREARLLETMKAGVMQELSQTQVRRLREISLQALGVGALADDTVAKRVGLNATQLTTVRKHLSEGLQKADKISKDRFDKAAKGLPQKPKDEAEGKKAQATFEQRMKASESSFNKQITTIRNETERKVLAVLSAPQRQTWTQLLGKPFRPA